LGAYLAGLIEGDGHIFVPTKVKDIKGRKIYPYIEIAFDIKDYHLFEEIKDVLVGGYTIIKKNRMSRKIFIKKKIILIKLINLINGCYAYY
jgi:hypothetical protein